MLKSSTVFWDEQGLRCKWLMLVVPKAWQGHPGRVATTVGDAFGLFTAAETFATSAVGSSWQLLAAPKMAWTWLV